MALAKLKKPIRIGLRVFVFLLLLSNLVAFFHAYKFTHFSVSAEAKTASPEQLSKVAKLKTLLFGVSNPRPTNNPMPLGYKSIILQSNKKIECWESVPDSSLSKGTVIIFHGYSGHKSSMLDQAEAFKSLGYAVMLVDFMGSGGSEGNQTTLGVEEAEQVMTAFNYIKNKNNTPILLFGTSMGAVAIMKSINDFDILPQSIILECPFGSMYKTTCARFRIMHAPTFPLAGFLVFWGGVQNGFWAFGHNPTDYAKKINCPTLLLYGERDLNVSREEIDDIYKNLPGPKQLKTFPLAGHENYLIKYKEEWDKEVVAFLSAEN